MLMNILIYGILGYLLSSVGFSVTEEPAVFFSFVGLFMLIDIKPWQYWSQKNETHNKS